MRSIDRNSDGVKISGAPNHFLQARHHTARNEVNSRTFGRCVNPDVLAEHRHQYLEQEVNKLHARGYAVVGGGEMPIFELARRYAESGADILSLGDDVGTQDTMLMDPDMALKYLHLVEQEHKTGSTQ